MNNEPKHNNLTISSNMIQTNIPELGPFDVLCGRDQRSYHNIGNRRFRIMIKINLPKYMECQTRTERSRMIFELTQAIQSCNQFRFLKRIKGGDKNSFIVLNHSQTREKIAHALRDAASQHKNMERKNTELAKSKNRQVAVEKMSAFKRMIANYETTNGMRNSDNLINTELAFQDEAADVEELSDIPGMRLSDIFDIVEC